MYIKSSILIAIFFSLGIYPTLAQVADFDEEAIEQDFVYNINLYGRNYIDPVIDGYGVNQTTGWEASALPLKPWEISINVHMASSFTPNKNLSFDFTEKPFTDNFYLADPSDPFVPTALGGSTDKEIIYEVEGQTILGPVTYQDNLPALSGTQTPSNATPSLSSLISVGLPKDFELTVRLFPPVRYLGILHYQVGGGAKHLISKYLLDEDSRLHFSIGAYYNYSQFSTDAKDFFDEGENQKVLFTNGTLALNSSLSYDMHPLSFWGVMGYYQTSNIFSIKGTYRFEVQEGALVQEAFSVTDPVNIKKISSNWRASFGVTADIFKRIQLSSSFQFAQFNTFSLRLGVLLNRSKGD